MRKWAVWFVGIAAVRMRQGAEWFAGFTLSALVAAACHADSLPRMTPMQAVGAPQGFIEFCARTPEACLAVSPAQQSFAMNAVRWREVSAINTSINQTVASASDLELFGEAEHWAIAQTSGDCEDYVLLKKQKLEALGYPSSALLITVVLDEKQEGHAVLTITADSGDYVLDNRRDEILPFTSTGYRYLKRQSQLDPLRWVSLAGMEEPAAGTVGSPGL